MEASRTLAGQESQGPQPVGHTQALREARAAVKRLAELTERKFRQGEEAMGATRKVDAELICADARAGFKRGGDCAEASLREIDG